MATLHWRQRDKRGAGDYLVTCHNSWQ